MKKGSENFDGHPEKPLNKMTPKEKLEYLSAQIELTRFIEKHVARKKRG